MNEIDKKVIKFLLSAAVYSDNAIMKNLGISEEELKSSYIIFVFVKKKIVCALARLL